MIRSRALVLLVASLTVACTAPSSPSSSGTPTSSPPVEEQAVVVGPASPSPSPPPVVGQGVVDVGADPDRVSELPTPSPTPPTIRRAEPDAGRAVRIATRLATDVGRRPAGSNGDAVARFTVASWLRAAGWEVTEQVVPLPQGGTSANLVATIGDRGPEGPHVVLGAHLDTVADSPGGNDNASGIGALVALAEEFADEAETLEIPLVLVAFGAEEYQPVSPRIHHIGSRVYAEEHGGQVLGMVSLDMLGNGAETCICWLSLGPDTMARRLAAVADDLSGGDGFRLRSLGDISDHGPFARRGIPAAFLWTGMDEVWHSPRDLPVHLDEVDVGRSLRLVAAFVRGLSAADRDALQATVG